MVKKLPLIICSIGLIVLFLCAGVDAWWLYLLLLVGLAAQIIVGTGALKEEPTRGRIVDPEKFYRQLGAYSDYQNGPEYDARAAEILRRRQAEEPEH